MVATTRAVPPCTERLRRAYAAPARPSDSALASTDATLVHGARRSPACPGGMDRLRRPRSARRSLPRSRLRSGALQPRPAPRRGWSGAMPCPPLQPETPARLAQRAAPRCPPVAAAGRPWLPPARPRLRPARGRRGSPWHPTPGRRRKNAPAARQACARPAQRHLRRAPARARCARHTQSGAAAAGPAAGQRLCNVHANCAAWVRRTLKNPGSCALRGALRKGALRAAIRKHK